MPKKIRDLIDQYVEEVKKIYGSHICQIILYGSYARGDFRPDSDIDIMILADISDLELKVYAQQLSYMTYDFNLDNDLDIKPIAKSEKHFYKWVVNYPFYFNISKEGIILYKRNIQTHKVDEDKKMKAFRELVKSIKENEKYLPDFIDDEKELQKAKEERYKRYFLNEK